MQQENTLSNYFLEEEQADLELEAAGVDQLRVHVGLYCHPSISIHHKFKCTVSGYRL